jgi:hypothetical protein
MKNNDTELMSPTTPEIVKEDVQVWSRFYIHFYFIFKIIIVNFIVNVVKLVPAYIVVNLIKCIHDYIDCIANFHRSVIDNVTYLFSSLYCIILEIRQGGRSRTTIQNGTHKEGHEKSHQMPLQTKTVPEENIWI